MKRVQLELFMRSKAGVYWDSANPDALNPEKYHYQ